MSAPLWCIVKWNIPFWPCNHQTYPSLSMTTHSPYIRTKHSPSSLSSSTCLSIGKSHQLNSKKYLVSAHLSLCPLHLTGQDRSSQFHPSHFLFFLGGIVAQVSVRYSICLTHRGFPILDCSGCCNKNTLGQVIYGHRLVPLWWTALWCFFMWQQGQTSFSGPPLLGSHPVWSPYLRTLWSWVLGVNMEILKDVNIQTTALPMTPGILHQPLTTALPHLASPPRPSVQLRPIDSPPPAHQAGLSNLFTSFPSWLSFPTRKINENQPRASKQNLFD